MMTKLMQILSERGNSAYDLLRIGLKEIKVPRHLIDMLPKFPSGTSIRFTVRIFFLIPEGRQRNRTNIDILYWKVANEIRLTSILLTKHISSPWLFISCILNLGEFCVLFEPFSSGKDPTREYIV